MVGCLSLNIFKLAFFGGCPSFKDMLMDAVLLKLKAYYYNSG